MSSSRNVCGLYFILLVIACVNSNAKEVTLRYKGLSLNADLELANGKSIKDPVILITHGGLAHNKLELIIQLASLLKDAGYNTLAINLGLGIDDRHGLYDCRVTHRHRHADAVEEISRWVNWLKEQGNRDVVLLGHSRGGGQLAWYAAYHSNNMVKAAVLMAPQTRLNGGAGYQARYNQPLQPLLLKAKELVKNGKGTTVIKHANMLYCRDTPVTAESFVSYYEDDPRLDSPYVIEKTKLPTLVLIAEKDEVVVGLDKRMAPMVDGKRVRMKIITGASHYFRDLNTEEAVETMDEFIKNVLPAR